MCFAVCLVACEKNTYYTTVVEETDNEETPMRDLNVKALSQSWLGEMIMFHHFLLIWLQVSVNIIKWEIRLKI